MVNRPPRASRIEIAPRTVILVGALIGAAWLVYELWVVAILVLVALMLVGTLSPLVAALRRRGVGRTAALLIVCRSCC
jgi:predicted PurR-regulated permease PerM